MASGPQTPRWQNSGSLCTGDTDCDYFPGMHGCAEQWAKSCWTENTIPAPRWGLKFQLQSDTARDLPGVGVDVPGGELREGPRLIREKEGQRSGGGLAVPEKPSTLFLQEEKTRQQGEGKSEPKEGWHLRVRPTAVPSQAQSHPLFTQGSLTLPAEAEPVPCPCQWLIRSYSCSVTTWLCSYLGLWVPGIIALSLYIP